MQSLRRLAVPAAAALPRRFACEARPAVKAPPTTEVLALSAELQQECEAVAARGGRLAWVFLGAPGVGKGTYASRVAALMGVPHVSAGDLVRAEIKAATPLAKQARTVHLSPGRVAQRRSRNAFCRAAQMAEITGKGQLLPDELVLRLLQRRLAEGAAAGERGVLLDGFPRTRAQAVSGGPDRGRVGVAAARQRWRLKLTLALRRRTGHVGRARTRAGGAQLEPARGGADREGTRPQLLRCRAALLACLHFCCILA
jgi:adenylate kinase family enzyme